MYYIDYDFFSMHSALITFTKTSLQIIYTFYISYTYIDVVKNSTWGPMGRVRLELGPTLNLLRWVRVSIACINELKTFTHRIAGVTEKDRLKKTSL